MMPRKIILVSYFIPRLKRNILSNYIYYNKKFFYIYSDAPKITGMLLDVPVSKAVNYAINRDLFIATMQ